MESKQKIMIKYIEYYLYSEEIDNLFSHMKKSNPIMELRLAEMEMEKEISKSFPNLY